MTDPDPSELPPTEVSAGAPSIGPALDDHARRQRISELYREHARFVWRTVRRLGAPEHALDDLLHEVFMILHRRLEEHDPAVAMRVFLHVIARGVVANARRKQDVRRRHRHRLPTPSAPPDPHTGAERAQAAAAVHAILGELDPRMRQVFELHELEGMTMPEVAQALGIKVNTAYSRLRLARARFTAGARRYHDRTEDSDDQPA